MRRANIGDICLGDPQTHFARLVPPHSHKMSWRALTLWHHPLFAYNGRLPLVKPISGQVIRTYRVQWEGKHCNVQPILVLDICLLSTIVDPSMCPELDTLSFFCTSSTSPYSTSPCNLTTSNLSTFPLHISMLSMTCTPWGIGTTFGGHWRGYQHWSNRMLRTILCGFLQAFVCDGSGPSWIEKFDASWIASGNPSCYATIEGQALKQPKACCQANNSGGQVYLTKEEITLMPIANGHPCWPLLPLAGPSISSPPSPISLLVSDSKGDIPLMDQ